VLDVHPDLLGRLAHLGDIDLSVDTECAEALLIDVTPLAPTQGWLENIGATVHNAAAWDESGRNLAFLTGITCPAP
jgi:hypothetical protein